MTDEYYMQQALMEAKKLLMTVKYLLVLLFCNMEK